MKVYHGERTSPGQVNVWVEENGKHRRLTHHVYHSPTGFEWGYGGSGPSDLARSIIWDLLGEQPRPEMYMPFKFAFVANWGEKWSMTEDEVRTWVLEHVAGLHEEGRTR